MPIVINNMNTNNNTNMYMYSGKFVIKYANQGTHET